MSEGLMREEEKTCGLFYALRITHDASRNLLKEIASTNFEVPVQLSTKKP